MGLTGGIALDPILSEFLSVGGFVNGSFGLSPSLLIGGGVTTTTDYSSSSTSTSLFYYNLNYGLMFSIGTKPVKLLFELSENKCSYDYSDLSSSSDYMTNYTQNYSNNISGTSKFIELKKGIGLRFGSYQTDSKLTFDIMYYFYTPIDYNRTWALNPPQHLFKLSLWMQSYFKFETTFGFKINTLSNDIKYDDRKDFSKFYLNFTIIYSKDFFSKSYF